MYCKYCGSRLKFDFSKCGNCGAKINLADGGQSFFEDKDLQEWATDKSLFTVPADIPHTEIKFEENLENIGTVDSDTLNTRDNKPSKIKVNIPPIVDDANFKENNINRDRIEGSREISKTVDLDLEIDNSQGKKLSNTEYRDRDSDYYTDVRKGTGVSKRRKRHKKNTIRISNSNKIIATYAGIALSCVVVIASLAAFIGNNVVEKNTDGISSSAPESTSDISSGSVSESEVKATDNTVTSSSSVEVSEESKSTLQYIKDMPDDRYEEAKEWSVLNKAGSDVASKAKKYMIDGTLYVSADEILPHFGYAYDKAATKKSGGIVYTNEDEDVKLTFVKGSKSITVESNGNISKKDLDSCVYNDENEGNTYVPIKSLCDVMGVKTEVDTNKHSLKINGSL